MWRWSGRGWTVTPWAPASRTRRAARATLGMPLVRVFRRVATLLTLTLSRVIAGTPSVAGSLSFRSGGRVCSAECRQDDCGRLHAQDAWPQPDHLPPGRPGHGHLLVGEAPLRPHRDRHVLLPCPGRQVRAA